MFRVKQVYSLALLLVPCLVTIQGAKQCGKINTRPSPSKLQGKIIRGYEVGYFKYPWFAALEMDGDVYCGGAFIGNNYVMTAAHCYDDVRGNLESYYKIRVGAYNHCKKEPTQTLYKVAEVIIHEKYKSNKPYYDIALLKLAGDTSPYMPICLPARELKDNEYEPEAWIVGFGSTIENNDNSYPCEMREGRILTYDNVTCRKMVEKLSEGEIKYARYIKAICAGYKSGTIDTCQGDSGGPLMMIDSMTNKWTQIGVTSYGWGCGQKNQLGVYTDVSKYLEWIKDESDISPTDYNQEINLPHNEHVESYENHNPTDNSILSGLADNFMKIYDHMMQSDHPPAEITIRFKNRPRRPRNKHGNQHN